MSHLVSKPPPVDLSWILLSPPRFEDPWEALKRQNGADHSRDRFSF
jgi:hypothetical protein